MEPETTSERKQKNLNLARDAREFLEEKSEEWYGAKKKQNRVVEHLIKFYRENEEAEDLRTEMREIRALLEEALDQEAPLASQADTLHTQGGGDTAHEATAETDAAGEEHYKNTTTDADSVGSENSAGNATPSDAVDESLSPAEELEQMAKRGETINPDEYDISPAKGKRGVDRAAIIKACMRDDSTRDEWGKEAIREFAMAQMGYKYNGANQMAEQVLLSLESTPLAEMEEEWLPERIEQEKESKEMQMNKRVSSPKQYERELGKSIAEYTGANVDADAVYVGKGGLAQGIFEAFLTLHNRYLNPANKYEKKRVRRTIAEYLERIDEELLETRVPSRNAPLEVLLEMSAEEEFRPLIDPDYDPDEYAEYEEMDVSADMDASDDGNAADTDADADAGKWEYDTSGMKSWEVSADKFEGHAAFACFVDTYFEEYEGQYDEFAEKVKPFGIDPATFGEERQSVSNVARKIRRDLDEYETPAFYRDDDSDEDEEEDADE